MFAMPMACLLLMVSGQACDELFFEEYSDLKNSAFRSCLKSKNTIKISKKRIEQLLESNCLKTHPDHFSKIYLKNLDGDLSIMNQLDENQFKKMYTTFSDFEKKGFLRNENRSI